MMMACARCGGLLVQERLFEANGMSSTERVNCERCLNCGALEDAIIRANRHAASIPVRSRKPRGPRSHSSHSPTFEDLSIEINPTDIHHELPVSQPYIYATHPGNHAYGQPLGSEASELLE